MQNGETLIAYLYLKVLPQLFDTTKTIFELT